MKAGKHFHDKSASFSLSMCGNMSWKFVTFLATCRYVTASWIDADTHVMHHSTKSLVDDSEMHLVFSDEFQAEGRSFADGHDPKWTSINKDDYTNDALQYYTDERVTTSNGVLNITTINEDITFIVQDKDPTKKAKLKTKNYQSGMLQGWNKFCFTGGVVEISARLPGQADIGGLWPAMWLLGNLARATYVGSSDNMWPWSYNTCSRDLQRQQEVSACNRVNHFDFAAGRGRGAPEIDIVEAMPGRERLMGTPVDKPYFSASLQTSPGVPNDGSRPLSGAPPHHPRKWYHTDLQYGPNTSLNIFFYGTHLANPTEPLKSYQTDAISANRQLDDRHFSSFHKYRLEWATGDEGYIRWYLDEELVYSITAATLNLTGSVIPQEPMYLILNTAVSKTWGFPAPCPAAEGCPCDCFDCKKSECQCSTPQDMCANLPAAFLVDYVRVYQSTSVSSQKVGCSTPESPSSRWIRGHRERYSGGSGEPLKEVQAGGGHCKEDAQCSAPRSPGVHSAETEEGITGSCVHRRCSCIPSYTGPRCQVQASGDPIRWDEDNKDSWPEPRAAPGFLMPRGLGGVLAAGAVMFVGVVGYNMRLERSRKMGGRVYEAI